MLYQINNKYIHNNKMSKFVFNKDFQLEILRFIVLDKRGIRVIDLISDSDFIVLEHAVLAYTLKKYYKKRKRIPGLIVFKEEVKDVFNTRKYGESLTKTDRNSIMKLASSIYKGIVLDGEELMIKVEQFYQFNALTHLLESTDISDTSNYKIFVERAQKAVAPLLRDSKDRGSFLIRDIEKRQFDRQDSPNIVPTPFRQINSATNAGGYDKGSVIVILDKPKQFKSGALINIAKGYLKMRKKILLFDLENGEMNLATRLEQSLTGRTKKEIYSGEYDLAVRKTLRKYKRLGSEFYVRRMPAFCTANEMRKEILFLKEEMGFEADILLVDYIGLMNSLSDKKDDHQRLADAYLDIANLAKEFEYDVVWSPHHVKEGAYVREKSKYRENDLAKSNEIGRHVHAIWGLNRNDDEKSGDILRMELVVQRDGLQNARALFKVDMPTQNMKEFTKEERKNYNEFFGNPSDAPDEDAAPKYGKKNLPKKPKGSDNSNDLD